MSDKKVHVEESNEVVHKIEGFWKKTKSNY